MRNRPDRIRPGALHRSCRYLFVLPPIGFAGIAERVCLVLRCVRLSIVPSRTRVPSRVAGGTSSAQRPAPHPPGRITPGLSHCRLGHRPEPRTPGSGGPPADFRLDRVAGRRQAPFAESAAGTGHSAQRIDAQGRRPRRPTWLAGPPHLKGDACVAPYCVPPGGPDCPCRDESPDFGRSPAAGTPSGGYPNPAWMFERPGRGAAPLSLRAGVLSAPPVFLHSDGGGRRRRCTGACSSWRRRRGWCALVPTGCGCLGACIPR